MGSSRFQSVAMILHRMISVRLDAGLLRGMEFDPFDDSLSCGSLTLCVFDLWVKFDSFFSFFLFLAGVKDWERGRSSGLKFFHGSPGLSFITISWFVKFYVLFFVVLFWYGIRNLDVFVGLYYEILMWLLVHYGFYGFDFKILSEGLGGECG